MKSRLYRWGLFFVWLISGLSVSLHGKETVLDFPENKDVKRGRNVPIKFHLPREDSAHPLIVVSHGAGGDRDGMFALSEEIAKQGYVVMCLEHVTSNKDSIRARMKNKGLNPREALVACGEDLSVRENRPLDVKYALDLVTRWNREHPKLKGRVDLSQIAMVGHSYGAYTTLVCCGAQPVRIKVKESLADPRVKLGIAMSPHGGNGYFFEKDSFKNLKTPLIGISGSQDITNISKSLKEREDCFQLAPKGDKYFIWFHDAGHSSFSDRTGSGRRGFMKADKDVTRGLKKIVPSILDVYLKGEGKLDMKTRNKLIAESVGGSVKKIEWKAK